MAIVQDNKQKYSQTSTTNTFSSASFTVGAGSNMYGIVFAVSQDGTNGSAASGVTWNGVAMTRLDSSTNGGQVVMSAWGLASPGTGVIAVTWADNRTTQAILAITYSGVKQTSQPDAVNSRQSSSESSGTTKTVTLTTIADNSMVVAAEASPTNTIVPTVAAHTMELSEATQLLIGAYAADMLVTPAGSNTATWTCGGSWGGNWQFASDVMISVSLAPVAAASGFIPRQMMMGTG